VVVVVVIRLVLVTRATTSSPSWLSRGMVVAVVVLVVAAVVAASSSRCSRPRVARGPEAEAQLGPGLATSGLQVKGGHPSRPPDAGEGGEEAVHLRLVQVDVLHVVEAHAEGHGGGVAAPSTVAILGCPLCSEVVVFRALELMLPVWFGPLTDAHKIA